MDGKGNDKGQNMRCCWNSVLLMNQGAWKARSSLVASVEKAGALTARRKWKSCQLTAGTSKSSHLGGELEKQDSILPSAEK